QHVRVIHTAVLALTEFWSRPERRWAHTRSDPPAERKYIRVPRNMRRPLMGLVDAQRLAQYISQHLLRGPERHLESNTPLISSGLLDSVSLIRVLTFIEDEFGATISALFV